jgi:acyl-CoA thioesterase
MTPQERAERAAGAMWQADRASREMGMRIDAIGPGRAVLSMPVQDHHLNGHAICHGGYIFALADSAFAFACNSYNAVTVAQQNQITFLSPGKPGERLTAKCEESALQGRSGVYDVTVTGEDGRVIALMRGLSRRIRGQNFDEDSAGGKGDDDA